MAHGPLTAYALLHQPWLRSCIEANKPDLTLYLAQKCRSPRPAKKAREFEVFTYYENDALLLRLKAALNANDLLTAKHTPLVRNAQKYLTDLCSEMEDYPFSQKKDWIQLKQEYQAVCGELEEKIAT